jgi:hypothetical protein
MKAVFHVVCGLILLSALWGCAMHAGSSADNETTQSYENALRQLRMGLDEAQVRRLLGPPGESEFYKSLDGSPVLVFHYAAPVPTAGQNKKTERTSLFFESGHLVMWGSKFYE